MNAYDELYFKHNGGSYMLETNNATGDRVFKVNTGPGLWPVIAECAITDSLLTAANHAWAVRYHRQKTVEADAIGHYADGSYHAQQADLHAAELRRRRDQKPIKVDPQGAGKGYNRHSGSSGVEDETPILNELRRNERYPFNK